MYGLDGTVNLARSQTTCANIRLSDRTVLVDSYTLNICIPFSSGVSIRVRNSVSGSLSFTANFTFPGHLPHLLINHKFASFHDASKIVTQYIVPLQEPFQIISLLIDSLARYN